MAENPIKKEDIIDVQGITTALKEIIGLLNDELNEALKNVTDSAKKYQKAAASANVTTKEGQETVKLASEAYVQLDKEQKDIIETKKKLTAEEKALQKLQQDELKYGKIQAGSYKDLTAKLKQLREETIRMAKPTQENINKIKSYETELKKLDATMGRHQRNVGNYKSALSGIGNLLGKLGLATVGAGAAIKTFTSILKSTESTANFLESNIMGIKTALDSMFKSIASGNLQDFFINIREAFKEGKNFALAMDEAEDKTRAFKIAESDAIIQTVALTKVARDATKSDKERIAAIDEIIKIETDLANKRKQLAIEELDLQLSRISKLNKVSKEELLGYIKRDAAIMNSVAAGQKFIDVLKNLDTSTQSVLYSMISMGNIALPDKLYIPDEVRNSWKDIVANMTEADKQNMKLAAGLQNVTDEEANTIVALYAEVNNATVAADENTMRMFSRRQSMIEEMIRSGQKLAVEEKRNQEEILDVSTNAANVRIGLKKSEAQTLAEVNTNIVANEKDIQDKLTQIAADGSAKRAIDWEETVTGMLEASREAASAISSIYEAQKNRELKAAGDNAEAREKIEKKYFEKQKKVSIAEALINGALGVTKAFAQGGILGFITGALITVATLAQVAVIASQTYAKGGFTGRGKGRDKTGERVAGVVHEEEFVLNKKTTKKYRPLIEAIHKDDPSAIANAIANKDFHAVHDKTAEVLMKQDPYTQKMYEIMKNSPTPYIDSNGNQVLKYPDGRTRIIKQKRALNYYPSMGR